MLKLPRSIKESYLFSRAYKKGKSAVLPCVVLYSLNRKAATPFSFGITVSKKQGGAVARNRAKRLLRESLRLIVKENPALCEQSAALVLVARHRCFDPRTKMQRVRADVEKGLRSLGLLP